MGRATQSALRWLDAGAAFSSPARALQQLSCVLIAKDRTNITQGELVEFRKLADVYARMAMPEIENALRDGALLEICHDN